MFSRVTIRLRNRLRGDDKDRCYVFGPIDDVEFDMPREPVVLPCDGRADLAAWQAAHGFKSYWNLR